MGRPREFNEEKVIQRALHAFWRQGYVSTSITDLLSATKLERGSLYKAFGDKRSLYELALEEYLETGRRGMKEILESAESPLLGIELWLRQVHKSCSGAAGSPGCLAVGAMVEVATSDAAVRKRLVRHWSLVARRLQRALAKGQALGEVRNDVTAKELAQCVIRSVAGIAVFARQGDRTNIADTMLAMLRL
jgi:TetR/AcrR family transcriptional repressor of nem operon